MSKLIPILFCFVFKPLKCGLRVPGGRGEETLFEIIPELFPAKATDSRWAKGESQEHSGQA